MEGEEEAVCLLAVVVVDWPPISVPLCAPPTATQHRTFPGHPSMDASGRAMLRRILSAYARRNPAVGYCQVRLDNHTCLETSGVWLATVVSKHYPPAQKHQKPLSAPVCLCGLPPQPQHAMHGWARQGRHQSGVMGVGGGGGHKACFGS